MASKKNYFDLNRGFDSIDYIAFFVPLAFFALSGIIVGSYLGSPFLFLIAFTVLWVGIFSKSNIRRNGENQWAVIERLGQFHEVAVKGYYVVLFEGMVDKVRATGTFKGTEPKRLFKDLTNNELDFTDGSAPVVAYGRYHIGNPEDRAAGRWDNLKAQVRLFVYTVAEAEKFVIEAYEAELRPRLQSNSIDQASKNGSDHIKEAVHEAALVIEKYGCYPTQAKAIYIDDIDVPDRIQKLRELVMQGEKEAEAALAGHQEPARAIIAIKKFLEEQTSETIPLERVMALVQQQRVLDMLTHSGAKFNFVSPDVGAVMKTFDVGGGS